MSAPVGHRVVSRCCQWYQRFNVIPQLEPRHSKLRVLPVALPLALVVLELQCTTRAERLSRSCAWPLRLLYAAIFGDTRNADVSHSATVEALALPFRRCLRLSGRMPRDMGSTAASACSFGNELPQNIQGLPAAVPFCCRRSSTCCPKRLGDSLTPRSYPIVHCARVLTLGAASHFLLRTDATVCPLSCGSGRAAIIRSCSGWPQR